MVQHQCFTCVDVDQRYCSVLNLVAKGVTTVAEMLSKVEALLDDCLTTVRAKYTGMLV